ncbi:hypothetical protein [Halopiger goleimassiliensis]|uniref:hypothetical protein n=1 Tax=Halopiger goleimassiliensis TaxID=1293048 RepID=UPI00067759CF|nr:hypothetical protein [Halopiger goleimassiliensis]
MQRFSTTTSSSRLDRLRNRLESALGGTSTPDGATSDGQSDAANAEESNPDAPGNLFHCPRCGLVYIAAEKGRCSQCDGDVEQVRSTLANR